MSELTKLPIPLVNGSKGSNENSENSKGSNENSENSKGSKVSKDSEVARY